MPCKPGKTHRYTVTSSVAGVKNCWWCGDSKRVAAGSYWAGRAFTNENKNSWRRPRVSSTWAGSSMRFVGGSDVCGRRLRARDRSALRQLRKGGVICAVEIVPTATDRGASGTTPATRRTTRARGATDGELPGLRDLRRGRRPAHHHQGRRQAQGMHGVHAGSARGGVLMEPEDDWEEGADAAADRYEEHMTRHWG